MLMFKAYKAFPDIGNLCWFLAVKRTFYKLKVNRNTRRSRLITEDYHKQTHTYTYTVIVFCLLDSSPIDCVTEWVLMTE